MKSLASLQARHDTVFYDKLARVPEAFRDALVAGGMADPGLLFGVPSIGSCHARSSGIASTTIHSKSAVVGGETYYSRLHGCLRYVSGCIFIFYGFPHYCLFLLPISLFLASCPFRALWCDQVEYRSYVSPTHSRKLSSSCILRLCDCCLRTVRKCIGFCLVRPSSHFYKET